MNYYLGIDGGGTKTEAVIINEDSQVVGIGYGGESNSTFAGNQAALDSFIDAISGALSNGKIEPNDIKSASCTFGNLAASAFEKLGIEIAPISVSEARVAFERAGFDELYGVALTAGTGSSCLGVNRDGKSISAGGWGALIGDDGSAHDIGRKGIRAALLAIEKRTAMTSLVAKTEEHFNLTRASQIIGKLSGGKVYQSVIASFAGKVCEAANEGDDEAIGIMESAGEDLGELAAFVAREVFEHDDSFPIVLSGGVFHAGRWITDPIKSILSPQFPNASIVLAKSRPGEAAAKIARSLYLRRDREC